MAAQRSLSPDEITVSPASLPSSQASAGSSLSSSSYFHPVDGNIPIGIPLTLAEHINPQFEPRFCRTTFRLVPRGSLKSRAYTREKTLTSKFARKRKRNSVIWQLGEAIQDDETNKIHWYCYHCEKNRKAQPLPVLNGTKNCLNHLRQEHHIDEAG